MAKTRDQKEQTVADLTDAFNSNKLAVMVDYRGLDVPAISALRASLRESDARFTVAKTA